MQPEQESTPEEQDRRINQFFNEHRRRFLENFTDATEKFVEIGSFKPVVASYLKSSVDTWFEAKQRFADIVVCPDFCKTNGIIGLKFFDLASLKSSFDPMSSPAVITIITTDDSFDRMPANAIVYFNETIDRFDELFEMISIEDSRTPAAQFLMRLTHGRSQSIYATFDRVNGTKTLSEIWFYLEIGEVARTRIAIGFSVSQNHQTAELYKRTDIFSVTRRP